MPLIRTLGNGKSSILKDEAFCELLGGALPPDAKLFTELFEQFNDSIKRADARITMNALNNVHGDWYEWLLAISAWNYYCETEEAHLAVLMPNVARFDVSKLYVQRLYDLVTDLKQKVLSSSSVQLITSNPDFVIIDNRLARNLIADPEPIGNINTDILSALGGKYGTFIDKCEFDDIVGYVSVKTSLRPDRRLQIPHEGSLMKALYAHLQTREWITRPRGLRYYAISAEISEPDKQALKTIATHSITTVFSLPQAAVDEVYKVNSLVEAKEAFRIILTTQG